VLKGRDGKKIHSAADTAALKRTAAAKAGEKAATGASDKNPAAAPAPDQPAKV
jgi:hypothetical protein